MTVATSKPRRGEMTFEDWEKKWLKAWEGTSGDQSKSVMAAMKLASISAYAAATKRAAGIAQDFRFNECDYERCNLKCVPTRIAQKIREQALDKNASTSE